MEEEWRHKHYEEWNKQQENDKNREQYNDHETHYHVPEMNHSDQLRGYNEMSYAFSQFSEMSFAKDSRTDMNSKCSSFDDKWGPMALSSQ